MRALLWGAMALFASFHWVVADAKGSSEATVDGQAGAGMPASGRPVAGTPAAVSYEGLPTWLWGEWRRDWILKDGKKTSPLDVHYLQTPTYYADVRIPKARPAMPVKSFAELTDAQLKLLAGQNGFTGTTALTASVATWGHDISYQPSDGSTDEGRLHKIALDRIHESGVDGSYVESWRRSSGKAGPFVVIRVEKGGRLSRTLVVVGNRFVYVRNRAKDLPSASSLETLMNANGVTREDIVGYLDCEFSVGQVRGGSVAWEILHSTLPWREGHALEFVEQIAASDATTALVLPVGDDESWSVPLNTLTPRQMKALFHLKP